MSDVRPATFDDVDLVAHIASAGFHDDPVMAWAFPDPARRRRLLVLVFAGLARNMLKDRGVVHVASDASVALWREPAFEHGGSAPEEAVDDGPGPFKADELGRLGVLRTAMAAAHPHEPHWYLNVLSTVPERQGAGLGAALLQPVLDECDAQGARAYLESSNPRNLSFYRRLGFVDAGEIPLEGGPSLIPMWREAHG